MEEVKSYADNIIKTILPFVLSTVGIINICIFIILLVSHYTKLPDPVWLFLLLSPPLFGVLGVIISSRLKTDKYRQFGLLLGGLCLILCLFTFILISFAVG